MGLNNKPSTSCHCPLLLANGSYALALGRDTKQFWGLNNKPSTSCHWFLCFGTRPRHQTWAPWLGPPRLKKTKSNFFTNRNILHTLKKEPLNIMLLHTSRTMDRPSIKKVPIVSRIFGVSSSTGLRIEGYLTCWNDELGNHSLGTKAQNMHQLRVLGAK